MVEVRADAAASTAQEGVHVSLRTPFEASYSWLDDLVCGLEVLGEQIAFIVVHEVYDLVVLSNHHH